VQNADVLRYAGGLYAVAIALALVGGTKAAAAPVPDGPRLAVVKWDYLLERQELVSVDRTGAQPLRLAGGGERKRPLPELFETPSWSPDGLQIAFTGMAHSFEAGPRGNRVYVVGADGKGLRPLLGTRGAFQPLFSRDGAAVAFTRSRRSGASIWLAPLVGGKPSRLTAIRRGLYMLPNSFSPDGGTLFASRFVQGRAWEDVVAVDMGSRAIETILPRASEAAHSPDGTRLAFVRWRPLVQRDGNRTFSSDIYTSGTDGSGVRRLTRTRFQDEAYPSWDPSGERLAFIRNLPEPVENDLIQLGIGASVLQMNADGSCQRKILGPSIVGLYGVAWQPGPGREAGRIAC
jgi:dipeptidyl aminopeptidase/acylaminoacyl peptidase